MNKLTLRTLIVAIPMYLALVLIVSRYGAGSLMHALVALPLVLILPGLLFVLAFVRSRAFHALEIFALAFGLNMSLLVASGLILNALPGGLNASSWTVTVIGLTLIGMAAQVYTHRATLTRPLINETGRGLWRGYGTVSRRSVMLGLASVGIVICAVWLAQSAELNTHATLTQFWLRRPKKSDDLGYAVVVRNQEGSPMTYRVQTTLNGRPLSVDDARISLPNDQEFTQEISIPASAVPGDELEVHLYRANQNEVPYRSLKTYIGEPEQ